jgi:hypothetical protein
MAIDCDSLDWGRLQGHISGVIRSLMVLERSMKQRFGSAKEAEEAFGTSLCSALEGLSFVAPAEAPAPAVTEDQSSEWNPVTVLSLLAGDTPGFRL